MSFTVDLCFGQLQSPSRRRTLRGPCRSNRTSRLPDNNRYGIGVGLTYAAFRNVDLQAAYLHVFFPTPTINETTSPTSGTLVGKYGVSTNVASIGIRVRF